jgi:aspartate-semialdehyde dehydrogenase
MPTSAGNILRVAIVGASSLRGKELSQVLEGRKFPADVRLLDEDVAVGTLTEAAGEPAVIASMDEESFERVRFAFFAGAAENTKRHWQQARRAGATVIDLGETGAELPGAVLWVPDLDAVLAPPRAPRGELFRSPAPASIIACTLAAALAPLSVARLAIVFFQPVSERGRPGIEELESQTVHLLSLKPIYQEVYDAQVAFNFLAGYGEASLQRLADVRCGIARDVADYLAGRVPLPAIQLIQAPVFCSYAFTAFVELAAPHEPAEMEAALANAGWGVQAVGDPVPCNVSVAGESRPVMARVEPAAGLATGYWFWGAADNLRLAAANAVSIAESLLAR